MHSPALSMTTVLRAWSGALVLLSTIAFSNAQEPARGGTLPIVLNPEPPILVSAFNSAAPIGVVSTKVLEGLLTYDFDIHPKPSLAETWKVSPDGRSITFNLRKGVKWHDGRDFTSADVQFSAMKVWKELHPRGRSTFAKLVAVETPAPNVAVFKLAEPSPYLVAPEQRETPRRCSISVRSEVAQFARK
jgi:peptide/nickel transport system substrate-binding protein